LKKVPDDPEREVEMVVPRLSEKDDDTG